MKKIKFLKSISDKNNLNNKNKIQINLINNSSHRRMPSKVKLNSSVEYGKEDNLKKNIRAQSLSYKVLIQKQILKKKGESDNNLQLIKNNISFVNKSAKKK